MTRSDAARARQRRERLLRHYDAAGEACRAAGFAWYTNAHREAVRISQTHGHQATHERVQTAAGVIAALSPRAQWAVNIAWSARVWDAAETGGVVPAVGLPDGRSKAWRIANGEHPDDVLRGPKVRAFYRAIMLDPDAAVIDVWAARAALPDDDDPQRWVGSERRYHQIADDYRAAAQERVAFVSTFQATIWLHVRGDKPADPSTFTIRDHR